ncbi:hypothetical protein [Corynebacterium freiburgense]|uniref:hypothetical protein n=1 Tax=Corynebacterium freiburgense TaxID=556548 RepID=UPI000427E35F|nr:hypothetical protein [Corynebacterium freiburgense]WJZ01529.1 hypothetical protein CFREI_01105 [Corynebacterium freiburgense]
MERALRYSILLFATLTLLLGIGVFAFDWQATPAVSTGIISAALSLMLENLRQRKPTDNGH